MMSIDDYDRYVPDYLGIARWISQQEKERCRRGRRARRESPPDELGGPQIRLGADRSTTVLTGR
jgi:hypothetical protein